MTRTPVREAVWAVDPAMSRLAFAFADLATDTIAVETLITHTDAREGERLGLLDRRVRIYARVAASAYPPACVWVEQPSGRFPAPQLTYAVGVLQAALYETLACPVWTIPSSAWKKRSVGVGNASKAQVAAWVEGLRIDVSSQDEADAVAIAWAGREMFTTRMWEAA